MKKNIYTLGLLIVSCLFFGKIHSQSVKNNFNSAAIKISELPVEFGSKQTNALWTNDFSNSNDWVILNEVSNNYNWTIGTTGAQGLFPIPTIYSPTATNGFAIFDSDKYCNGKQKSSLITANPISLLGHNNVALKFCQQFKRFYDSTFVFVSNDGLNWKKYIVNKNLPINTLTSTNPELVTINITEVAANKPSVWIKFTYYSDTLTMGPQAGCNYSWMIDDVSIVDIPNNGLVVEKVYFSEYSKIPKGQQMPVSFSGEILNQSPITRHNVRLNVKVNSNLYDYTSSLGDSLVLGQEKLYSLTNTFNPTSIGIYAIDFEALQTELDPNPIDNSKRVYFAISDSVYSRDNFYYSGSGYWNGHLKPYEMGNIFHTNSTKIASSISVVLQGNTEQGASIKAKIYKKTTSGFTLVAQSSAHIVTSSEIPTTYGVNPVYATIRFDGAPVILEANSDYLAAIAYDGGNKNCAIADGSYINQPANTSYMYDTPHTTWFATTYTPMIRLNLAYCSLNLTATGISDTCMSGKGKATVTLQNGTSPFFYNWSSSINQHSDSSTTTNLVAGIYTIAVADSRGCTGNSSIIIGNVPVIMQATTTTDNSFCGNPNGVATVQNINGGTPPYNYLWNTTIDQANTSSSTINLFPGIYAVTITDSKGCKADTTVVVQNTNLNINFNHSAIASTCHLPNGKAYVSSVINGSQPYSFKWNTIPQQTSDTAFNVSSGWLVVTVTDSKGCYGKDSINVLNNFDQPSIITNTSNTSLCAMSDGKAWVNHPSPDVYNYSWSTTPIQHTDTAYNLSAGIYSVIVTESSTNCFDTAYVNISDGLSPSLIIDSTKNVNCFGGNNGAIYTTFSAIPVSNYKFINTSVIPNDTITSASEDLSGLKAGHYKIIAYSGVCVSTNEVIITEPMQITNTIETHHSTCYGTSTGYCNSYANGGSGNLNYMWIKLGSPNDTIGYSQNLTNANTGKYQLVINDANQCKLIDSTTILQPAKIEMNITFTNILCHGQNTGSASIISLLNAIPPYSFLWSNNLTSQNINSLAQNTYKVTVTDNFGCKIVDSVAITAPSPITISVSSLDSAHIGVAEGAISVAASGGSGNELSYQWSNGVNGPSINGLLPDVPYSVTVTDGNNCIQTATYMVPKTYIGTIDFSDDQSFAIYPNPTKEVINISLTSIKSRYCSIKILNSNSIEVYEQKLISNDGNFYETVNLRSLKPGVYTVVLSTNSIRVIRKLIKI